MRGLSEHIKGIKGVSVTDEVIGVSVIGYRLSVIGYRLSVIGYRGIGVSGYRFELSDTISDTVSTQYQPRLSVGGCMLYAV
jgi:hypothetical protein